MVEVVRRYVIAHKLHGDNTLVPVLAPGNGKTKTGRLWTHPVRPNSLLKRKLQDALGQ